MLREIVGDDDTVLGPNGWGDVKAAGGLDCVCISPPQRFFELGTSGIVGTEDMKLLGKKLLEGGAEAMRMFKDCFCCEQME